MTPERARSARVVVRVTTVAAALVLLLSVRVWVSSSAELSRAQAAAANGDTHATITHLRRAARWYAPLCPYPRDALMQLLGIARTATAAEDSTTALRAYRAVRAATQAARSFYLPHADLAEQADRGIARITARIDVAPADVEETPDEARREARALEALRAYTPPSFSLVFGALAGFAVFLVGLFGLALRAIDEEDRWVRPAVRRWGGLAVLGATVSSLALALC